MLTPTERGGGRSRGHPKVGVPEAMWRVTGSPRPLKEARNEEVSQRSADGQNQSNMAVFVF